MKCPRFVKAKRENTNGKTTGTTKSDMNNTHDGDCDLDFGVEFENNKNNCDI